MLKTSDIEVMNIAEGDMFLWSAPRPPYRGFKFAIITAASALYDENIVVASTNIAERHHFYVHTIMEYFTFSNRMITSGTHVK